ncbi:MAG TPA: CBS domain-containing protein [Anaerolineae bacterium]|nr:CBS domain-containing protein [Anaerolineae bacterium]HID84175.1 CBS domain-containing protein [Anaerolineales bacterium]HIQ09215.1 CBS domain-containing protein [Anaerolineaceae bacterium]
MWLPKARPGLLDALLHRRCSPTQGLTARDLMSPGVLTASAEATLGEALAQILAANRRWLVVVDAEGRALGLLHRQRALSVLLPPWPEATRASDLSATDFSGPSFTKPRL